MTWHSYKKNSKAQFEVVKIAEKYSEMGNEEQTANLFLLMESYSAPILIQLTFHATEVRQAKTLNIVIAIFDT